jgi:ABC-2 type transport system ATP-binding protein
LIEVQHLTKHYGSHVAVSDVSFEAGRGEILGFLGPNGAGKTTTMRMLTCYLPPTSGTATICGYDILDQSLEVRRRIGYLPENVPLYTDLIVRDYLDFVGRLKGMRSGDRRSRIDRVMRECGVDHVAGRQIGNLSRGYRQRVGLAQALLNDPQVLILDEPTVGLDPRQIIEIRELIRSLAGERTIILSTHILPEVSLLCERVIIIDKGRLIEVDTPDNLKKWLQRAMTIMVRVRGELRAITEALTALPGVAAATHIVSEGGEHEIKIEGAGDDDIRERVSQSLVNGGFGLVGLTRADMSLEEVFVELVTEEGATG